MRTIAESFRTIKDERGNLFLTDGNRVYPIEKPKRNFRDSRSEAQMSRRIQFSNLVTSYQALAPFMRKEAWQSLPERTNAFHALMKENLGSVKVYLDKGETKEKACIVAPYRIAGGSLPAIETTMEGDRIVTSLRLSEGFTIADDTAVGDVASELVHGNRFLEHNDRLTIVHLEQLMVEERKVIVPHVFMNRYEFVLDSSSRVPFRAVIPEAVFCAMDGQITIDNTLASGGIAYILSREVRDKRYVSTQSIVLTPDNHVYSAYSSEEKRLQALQSYGIKKAPCLDPEK
ncbi:hypothetical protein EZS27_026892 [termite gut metagenome]|uniref:Uncharacterized protein n=1 Tax=termite gut metagenome TaxID=433724 RepID=A0A5J4QS37_9ZZZZ